jgi:uncharacterized membrane protein
MEWAQNEWLNLVLRWIHVVAGVVWIGHLYFFNWVNSQVAKTYDADSKKKVVPELMPRALYWFRWGAAYTWISGILLLGVVIYMGGVTMEPGSAAKEAGIGLGSLVVAFFLYDLLWSSPLGKSEPAAVVVSFVLLAGAGFGLSQVLPPRSTFIHIGALMGTIMAANVWMRIWPAQRKIIAATKEGQAPDAALPAIAGLRSKHNTYMSVPLILLMVSSHFPTIYGYQQSWAVALGAVAVGWALTKLLYIKAATPKPAKF